MTDAEHLLHHDLHEANAKRRIFARDIEALLNDARDALEIEAHDVALSRIKRAIASCVAEQNT